MTTKTILTSSYRNRSQNWEYEEYATYDTETGDCIGEQVLRRTVGGLCDSPWIVLRSWGQNEDREDEWSRTLVETVKLMRPDVPEPRDARAELRLPTPSFRGVA